MGRLTTYPIAPLLLLAIALLGGCGGGGSSGGGSGPVPLPRLMDMAAQLGPADSSPSDLFTTDAPLEFILAADFDQLRKDRSQESEERPGKILISGFQGSPVEVPIQVKTRGIFRLQRRTCQDPPLRLNLPESIPLATVLDGQDKLKLVTHCRDSDSYEQNLLEEYLTYRIYNQLTEISFRVRLAKVTYVDSSGKHDPFTQMAFLIEDEDAMAARQGGIMIETPVANPEAFVRDQLSLMYVFQFMVGNVDWGVGGSHNVKILLLDGEYYPIPYDFDWAGLVDAPYAGPNVLTEPFHRSVRERVYWGACLPGIDYQQLFDRFNQARDGILSLVQNQVGLSERNRDSAQRYVEEFYSVINEPRRAERDVINACRKW